MAATASAQTFPADSQYVPLYGGGGPMFDLFQDESGAIDERDIVGDGGAPAGLRAADADVFYLRLRLDRDPAPDGALRPHAWGMEIDLDGDTTTYEILMMVDGTGGGGGVVSLYRNTSTTLPNDPSDPANEPPVATYDFASHGRSTSAEGSSYGGDADFFLDFAVPWDDLAQLNLEPDTPIFVWAASSSTAATLNGDFACHDGRTGIQRSTGSPPTRPCSIRRSTAMEMASLMPRRSAPALTRTTFRPAGSRAAVAAITGHDRGPVTFVLMVALVALCARRLIPPRT